MEAVMLFREFLKWAQNEGIQVCLGVILSFVVEWFPQFENLEWKMKRVAFLGITVAIPVIAAVVSVAFGYQTPSFTETFWPALAAGFLSFMSGTMAHLRKK